MIIIKRRRKMIVIMLSRLMVSSIGEGEVITRKGTRGPFGVAMRV